MAWPEQLPSGKWRAVWRDERNVRRSKSGFTQEAAAKRFGGEQESKARRGEATYDGRSPKWGDWRDEWLALRSTEAATERQDRIRVDRYLTPHWANQRLNRITRADVQRWVNELAHTKVAQSKRAPRKDDDRPAQPPPRELSPATVDRIYRLFSTSMREAVIHGRLGVSPCLGITLPAVAPGHERYLSRGEVDLILFHLNEPYKTAVTILAGTGLRFGELAGLHWQRVDLDTGLIDVVETWDAAARRIKGYPKSTQRRSVPIVSWVQDALEDQVDRQGDGATSCGLPHAATTRCRSGLVVPAPEGGALDAHNLGRRDWADAVRLSGVGPTRLHDLRHTFASWLVQDGVPLQEVQRLLGHASLLTTQRYAHLGTSQSDRVRSALEGR